jgi:thiol-disulfide isomerase/thioredoxin
MAQRPPTKHLTQQIALALAFALALALFARALAAAPPRVGTVAPPFDLPVVANGTGKLTLESLRGHGVYLNFFASWCEPCKEEVPYIGKLSTQYGKQGVTVVGIDELESADRARQFALQYHLPYRVVLDNSGDTGGDYGLLGLPLHVFIAPNGTVAEYHVGEMSETQVQAALQNLTKHH